MSETILLFMGVLVVVSLVVVLFYTVIKLATTPYFRRIVRHAVFSHLVTITRQDLPLAPALRLAAAGERGVVRRTLGRVAQFLSHGLPLSQALRRGYPSCPGIALSLVTAGEGAGRLPAALRQAHNHLVEHDRLRRRVDPGMGPYVFMVFAFLFLVVTMIMVVIIPKFEEIFMDFDTALPAMTVNLIAMSRFVMMGSGWVVLMVLLVVATVAAYYSIRPRRTPDPYLVTQLVDTVRWSMPGLRRMQFGAGMANMLEFMRTALGAGMPLEDAARLTADIDANCQLRSRMARFADLLSAGRDPQQAARAAGLGDMVAAVFGSGHRRQDIQAALRYAADYHAALVSRWWLVVRSLTWPAVTLVLATFVGYTVIAMFMPLVALNEAMIGAAGF